MVESPLPEAKIGSVGWKDTELMASLWPLYEWPSFKVGIFI